MKPQSYRVLITDPEGYNPLVLDLGDFDRIADQSAINNQKVNWILSMLVYEHRVLWAGIDQDPREHLNAEVLRCENVPSYDDIWGVKPIVAPSLDYHLPVYIINESKGEQICLEICKQLTHAFYGGLHPLPVLTALTSMSAKGDFMEKYYGVEKYMGYWAFDRLMVSFEPRESYKMITPVFPPMSKVTTSEMKLFLDNLTYLHVV